jgi:fucose permease
MTIAKTVLEAVTIVSSEVLVTAIFVVCVVPMLVLGVKHDPGTMKAVGLGAACWVTITSPFYWLLMVATVTLVVWLFRR